MRPVLALLLFLAVSPLFAQPSPCPNMRPDVDIVFQGKTLREIADITDPELRTINRMITAGCYAQAYERLGAFAEAHPEQFHADFVAARLSIYLGDMTTARRIETESIRKHPDFASLNILMASDDLSQLKFDDAKSKLDTAARTSPNDLWLFLDRLQAQSFARDSRPATTEDTLKAIVADTRFPPNARRLMGEMLIRDRYGDAATEWAYLQRIDLLSGEAREHEQLWYAQWLVESKQRTVEGRKLAEPHLGNAHHDRWARRVLTTSYLFDAVKIDAAPTARNAEPVRKAREISGGDFSAIARDAALQPHLSALVPFLHLASEVDNPREEFDTALCASVGSLIPNVETVRQLLDAGADPNKPCEHATPLGKLFAVGGDPAIKLQMMRVLLEHGADPNPAVLGKDAKTYCRENSRCDPFRELFEPLWAAEEAALAEPTK
jgi:hypothetical protein